MKPSKPVFEVPGDDDPTHDAVSAWLLRAAPAVAGSMLAAAHPSLRAHTHRYEGIELEVLIGSDPYGIADARLDFSDGMRLWIEIKTDDREIGALIRQVKMYRQRITGESRFWLAVLPYCSVGGRELLAHAGIGVWCTPAVLPHDLMSLSVLRGQRDRFDSIPDAGGA